ncbi:MAG TPA: response regulator transcription factor [Stellaceae bacterium]|nr:response regulator transcription factor [Stellaceae bacterium]
MRAIVADDHPLYREAVRLRLERLFPAADVAEVAAVDELLQLGARMEARLDLVLLDLHMPGMAGAEGIGRVIAAFPGSPVVMMSGLAESADVQEAIRAGARGFLPKTMAPDLFAAALSLVIGGGTYLPAEVLQPQPTTVAAGTRSLLHVLTPREQQVLVRLATGAPNKEIGRDLGLAEVTVKLHVRQILKKIDARNRSEAAAIATRAGLI